MKQETAEAPAFKISSPISLRSDLRKAFGINKEVELRRIVPNHSQRSSLPTSDELKPLLTPEQSKPLPGKHWTEEFMNFSTHVVRLANITLNRVKEDFVQSGMQFDSEVRNHFLYVANSR